MDMLYRPNKEPLNRLRAAVPVAVHKTLEQLLCLTAPPVDQSSCATVISNMAACLIAYGKTIPHVRTEFAELLRDAATILTLTVEEAEGIQGMPPALSMYKRVTQFEAWTLLGETPLTAEPIRMAIGAEIAKCLLSQGMAHEPHFRQLRKALEQYGRRPQGQVPLVDDLVDLNFGKDWFPRYVRNDSFVRQCVEIPDPDGPQSPRKIVPRRQAELMLALRNRSLYVNVKHRQASLDDSHLTPEQFRKAADAIRQRVQAQIDEGVVQALCVLTGWAPEQVCSLPLLEQVEQTDSVTLDVRQGLICINLAHLFPGRRKPTAETVRLFHHSTDWLKIPMPLFLGDELRARRQQRPNALLLGELVNWVDVKHRDSVIEADSSKLKCSLSRASQTTGSYAIHSGCNRLVAANVSLDYSLIGSARMYYARLPGQEIVAGTTQLLANMGWGCPVADLAGVASIGSRCVLTDEGVKTLFRELTNACRDPWPGRRGGPSTLLAHHTRYTVYCAALLSFCLGLRETGDYQVQVVDVARGQCHIRIHDKHAGDQMMAQVSRINALVVEQIRLYLAHCHVLMRRLTASADPTGFRMVRALELQTKGVGPLFLIPRQRGAPEAAGSSNTWQMLPAELRVPANVGRHYWQNVLRARGLSSGDIDRFMRHRVIGLENNSNSSLGEGVSSFERIDAAQVAVLSELGVQPVIGLAGASK